MRNKIVNIRT